MARALVMNIPTSLAIGIGFAVSLSKGWRLGLLWGAVTFVVLLVIVLAAIRVRCRRRLTRT